MKLDEARATREHMHEMHAVVALRDPQAIPAFLRALRSAVPVAVLPSRDVRCTRGAV